MKFAVKFYIVGCIGNPKREVWKTMDIPVKKDPKKNLSDRRLCALADVLLVTMDKSDLMYYLDIGIIIDWEVVSVVKEKSTKKLKL